MTPRKDQLDDVRAPPIKEVCSASGHALKVASAGRAAFKGADVKPVVLHHVLFVPDLKANLIFLPKLAKAGVSTSTDGSRTYKGQLGNRVLWESKDMYRSILAGRSKKPLELVHMDLVGPQPVQGHKGQRYIFTIVDDWSRLMWASPLKQKDHAASKIRDDWLPFVEKQAEFVSIQREQTTAYTPQSNGVAERANRTILETARELLIESVDMLRVFGCMAVAHVPKKYRSKLGANAVWCVHLGLAAESTGWLLWKPCKGMLFDSRDLDLTPSVLEEGEEVAAEGGDGERVQEAHAGGGGGVEASGSTSVAAGSKGADVAEKQLGNEEVLLILPQGYDPDGEDEPAYFFLAPAPDEQASMEEALAGPDRDKWLASRDVLEEKGFRASSCDESLFLKGEKENLVMFLVYVDDILLFSSSMKEIQNVQQQVMENFKCKTLGEVKYYLGMHVERDLDHRWLKLHQEKFIKELGEKYVIENECKVANPLPAELKLLKAAEDDRVEAEEQQHFQSLVGSLLYATVHTRPDISFSVGQLARMVQNPSEEQVDAAERVVKYLNSHPSIGVQYSAFAQVK
ncbi:unnamed protein product [Closterium sp. NIES-53]